MKTSLFTRFLQMKGGTSLHEQLFNTFIRSLGDGQFSDADPTFVKAFAFAFTGAIAAAAENSETAWGQQFAETAYDLLGQQEREHGITSNRKDSVTTRRAVLGAKKRALRGGSRINVENALKVLLGSAFIGWFTTPPAARVTWPAALGDAPQNFVQPGTARKLAQPRQADLGGARRAAGVALHAGHSAAAAGQPAHARRPRPPARRAGDPRPRGGRRGRGPRPRDARLHRDLPERARAGLHDHRRCRSRSPAGTNARAWWRCRSPPRSAWRGGAGSAS